MYHSHIFQWRNVYTFQLHFKQSSVFQLFVDFKNTICKYIGKKVSLVTVKYFFVVSKWMHGLTELTSFQSFNCIVCGCSEPASLPCGSVFVDFPGSRYGGQPICIMIQDDTGTHWSWQSKMCLTHKSFQMSVLPVSLVDWTKKIN